MDSNDATILALALGIPSATFLSIAFLLVLRIQHRQLQAWRILNPTVSTNSPTPPSPVDPYYGIPLEQRPPRIVAPLPRWPIPLNEFNRAAGSEERPAESISPSIPPPRPPTPPRRHMPVIIISPTTTTEDSLYAPRSLSPGEYTHYWDNGRGFDVGHDIRVTAPPTCDHTWDANPAAPSAPVSPSEFWDNITIPYSTYFPAPRDGSPEHRTPPPASAYTQHRGVPHVWDQPVRPPSRHSSLYRSRNPSPVAQPSQFQTTAATGRMSSSSVSRHVNPDYTKDVGGESTSSSEQSHGLHRSYSCPLSRDTMSTSPVRLAERAPSRSSLDPPCHSQTRPPTPMEA